MGLPVQLVFYTDPSPQDDAMLFVTLKSAAAEQVPKVLQVVEQAKRIRHKAGGCLTVIIFISFVLSIIQVYLKMKNSINTSFTIQLHPRHKRDPNE